MPSFARAILEMRSSFAFCAISMSEGINCSLCCGTALCLILWARHYKGGAFGRTLTEIKIQVPADPRGARGTMSRAAVFATSGMMEIRAFLQERSSGLTRGGVRWQGK